MSIEHSATSLPFVFVDYGISPYDALAQDVVNRERPNPADLSQYLIWCESAGQTHTIKLSLINAAEAAGIKQLLLPTIVSLQDWLWQQAAPEGTVLSESAKQLLLVEAIRQSPTLFQLNNAWPLAKELVNLFNECSLAQVPLGNGEDNLRNILLSSYQYPTANIENISRESEIVYRLWLAYKDQIQANDWIDPVDHYCQCLIEHDFSIQNQTTFVVGKQRLHAAEAIFLHRIGQQNSVAIFATKVSEHRYGESHHPYVRYINSSNKTLSNEDSREQALDIIYDNTAHTHARAEKFSQTFQENIFTNWLSLYTCKSIDDHVTAVCLQVKQWLISDINNIGIISNDRSLIRRIRAVLEEQGIQATDLGGWTLSTTSAATSIEVLLDAIEHNFRKDLLLDLLSSPFLPENSDTESAYIQQVYAVKKFLKKHRSSPNDSLESLSALAAQMLEKNLIDHTELCHGLEKINTSCKKLHDYKNSGEYSLSQFSDKLINTLNNLGMHAVLENDIAGQQLLEVLSNHIQSIRHNTIRVNWREWRQWLRDIFEDNYFFPESVDKRVTLCGFEHIDSMRFDATIIAGVEENRLTNTKSQRTFFNEKVRHELHLPTTHEANAINFLRFRQIIQNSKHVLLSAEIEKHGEPQTLSSWVTLINVFSQHCYQNTLDDNQLSHLIQAYNTDKQNKLTSNREKTVPAQVNAPADLIPRRISATQYQSLIDCPYQYFAKYILNVRDMESTEEFEASDYGMLVHQCLNEFHFDDEHKSELTFNSQNRKALIEQLTQLSRSIFMHSAFPTTVKQGWLQRWLNNVPAYIDWSIERAKQWRSLRGESMIQTHLNDDFTLYGQIDRIDSDTQHLAVVDYKTSSVKPTKNKVINGELVQLPFYALLDDNITQAEYLSLGIQGEAKASAVVSEQELSELKEQHKPRLESLLNQLLNDATLRAQGNENSCRVCDYHGLCRKEHWSEND